MVRFLTLAILVTVFAFFLAQHTVFGQTATPTPTTSAMTPTPTTAVPSGAPTTGFGPY